MKRVCVNTRSLLYVPRSAIHPSSPSGASLLSSLCGACVCRIVSLRHALPFLLWAIFSGPCTHSREDQYKRGGGWLSCRYSVRSSRASPKKALTKPRQRGGSAPLLSSFFFTTTIIRREAARGGKDNERATRRESMPTRN